MSQENSFFRSVLLLVFALAVLAAATPAFSQTAPRIGIVNIARLLEESPQARSAMQALQDEFAPRQREIVAQQEDLRVRGEQLQRDGSVMAEAERRAGERDLRDMERELTRSQNEYLEDLNIRRNEELGQLQRSLMQEVQKFAAAQSFDLILGDGVLYASGGIDITSQVLAGLEASFQPTANTNKSSSN